MPVQLTSLIQSNRTSLLLLLFLLPLLFCGIRQYHDWGDDFAQYIHQAESIVEGESALEVGYIYNPTYPMLGPKAYPGGFPLLLTPITALFGNDITVFNYYISFWLIVAGFIWFLVLKRYHNELTAFLLTLIWCWHPWVLQFKTEVMADIPFTALIGLLVLVHQKGWLSYTKAEQKKSVLKSIGLGSIAGFLLAIKMQGLIIIIMVFAYSLLQDILKRKFNLKNFFTPSLFMAAFSAFIVCFIFVNYLISGIKLEDLLSYGGNFSGEPLLTSIRENLTYYTALVQEFFQQDQASWKVFPLLTQALIIAICIIGMIRQITSRGSILFWVFIAYLLLLLIYPYRGSGFRFLLPIAPILLHLFVEGFKSIKWGFSIPTKAWTIGLTVILMLQYLPEQLSILRTSENSFPGPQEKESQEAFDYIVQNTPEESIVFFKKPRALALYTGRKSFAVNPHLKAYESEINDFQANYVLLHREVSPHAEREFVESKPDHWQLIWSNEKLDLYAKK